MRAIIYAAMISSLISSALTMEEKSDKYFFMNNVTVCRLKSSANECIDAAEIKNITLNFTEHTRQFFQKSYQVYIEGAHHVLPLLGPMKILNVMAREFESGGLMPHEFAEIGEHYRIENINIPLSAKASKIIQEKEKNAAQLAMIYTLSNLKKADPIRDIVAELNAFHCSPNSIIADFYYAFKLNNLNVPSCCSLKDMYEKFSRVFPLLHNLYPPQARMHATRFCLSLIDLFDFSSDTFTEFLAALRPTKNRQEWKERSWCMSHKTNKIVYEQLCNAFAPIIPYFSEDDYYELYRLAPMSYSINADLDQKLTAIQNLVKKARDSFDVKGIDLCRNDYGYGKYWYWHLEKDLQRLIVPGKTPRFEKDRLIMLLEAKDLEFRRECVVQTSILMNKVCFMGDCDARKSMQPGVMLIALYKVMSTKMEYDQNGNEVSPWDLITATKSIISKYTSDTDAAYLLKTIAEVPLNDRAECVTALEKFTNQGIDDASEGYEKALSCCGESRSKELTKILARIKTQKIKQHS
jgi:hypothetical protein